MSTLRLLHVIPSVSPKHGGPSVALPLFLRSLAPYDVKVTIATTDDDGPGGRLNVPLEQMVPGPDKTDSIYFRRSTEFYKTSRTMARWLDTHVTDYDAVHIHALFSFSSFAAARAARRAAVPYVVRPLGVLNEWGMRNRRRWLKRWSLRMIELPILRHAAAIHYTAEAEQREAAAAHPDIASLRSVVIPIPLDVGQRSEPSRFYDRFPATAQRRIVLFLSRLDPKKGVELLISAFQKIRAKFPDALLVIAGSGEQAYVESLRQKTRELGCERDVLWTGFIEGEEKSALFAAATLFVLPSYSENFGIAAAEALAAGVPSILSEQVAIAQDAAAAQAAITVPCEVEAIAKAMGQLLDDSALRERLSRQSRALMKERFSLETIGSQLLDLYQSL